MRTHPHFFSALRLEFSNRHLWHGRGVVIAFAGLAGLTVVGFTWLTDHALATFDWLQGLAWWGPLLWMPASTAAIVYLTRRFAPGAAGSGIPQVIAALEVKSGPQGRGLFVSLKLTFAKIFLTAWGLLAGLSLGREGPSVQIAAGIMHNARRWVPRQAHVSDQSLLIAGGAAGIAAAFNTPLGGVMFAIEELSKGANSKSSSLMVVAIVVGGLMGVSAFGNASYFGVIRVENVRWFLLLPALLVAVVSGLAGGLFSRLLLQSLSGRSPDRFSAWRKSHPIWFAAGCGLAVAIIGLVSHGQTYGSGYANSRAMLEDSGNTPAIYVLFKFVASWLTTWAGVPAGIFAPSLAIGGALGNDIALLTSYANAPTLIALGMAGFLAAVTQAPLTSFIIVMEMVDGHALVLSLMACALVASGISRLLSPALYPALAELQLARLPASPSPH